MDLTHFWNVVAMLYPEDHSSEWTDFMIEIADLAVGDDADVLKIPTLGSLTEQTRLSKKTVMLSANTIIPQC